MNAAFQNKPESTSSVLIKHFPLCFKSKYILNNVNAFKSIYESLRRVSQWLKIPHCFPQNFIYEVWAEFTLNSGKKEIAIKMKTFF